MRQKILFTTILIVVITHKILFCQIPSGYYTDAEGKTGAQLKTALFNKIKGHTDKGYTYVWTAFNTTDKKANGKVWDIYSSKEWTFSSNQCGNYGKEGDCYNREHSFPKSWFSDASPMHNDLFHLYPSDGYVNGIRGNLVFGEVGTANYTSTNGCKRGNNVFPGYSGTVFEPADEYKGDLARTYFYFATRYEDRIAGWENNDNDADAALNGTTFPVYEQWYINLLAKWHNQDPVSQKEIERNNTIYAIQGNRNPYIDHPEYAGLIWNFSVTGGNTTVGGGNTTTPGTNPPSNQTIYTIDFSNCANTNWAVKTVNGTKKWTCSGSGYFEANGYISASSSASGSESWLISPVITSTGSLGVSFVSYNRYTDNGISTPEIGLFYSTNYEITTPTWTEVTGFSYPAENAQLNTPSGIATISGINSGQTLKFAFKYRSSGSGSNSAALWRVDDFRVISLTTTVNGVTEPPTIPGVNTTPSPINNTLPTAADVTVSGLYKNTWSLDLSSHVSDTDGDALRFSPFTNEETPLEGMLNISESGLLTYKAAASLSQSSRDVYFYTVCDTKGGCSTANIRFDIVVPEIAANGAIYSIEKSLPLQGNINNLYAISPSEALSLKPFVGTLSKGGSLVLNANGNFSYIPAPGFEGTEIYSYTVCSPLSCAKADLVFSVTGTTTLPSSLEENTDEDIKVWPNPFETSLYVGGKNVVISKLKIYNSLGQEIETFYNQKTINLGNYESGTYTLKVFIGNSFIKSYLVVKL